MPLVPLTTIPYLLKKATIYDVSLRSHADLVVTKNIKWEEVGGILSLGITP
jgi:hypothetical protein